MKNVLHNLTDGPLSALDSERDEVRSHVQYDVRTPSGSSTERKSPQVNDGVRDLHEQHFMQLLASLKCYPINKDDLKAFGMYVVMNRVYFTAVYVVPNNQTWTNAHSKLVNSQSVPTYHSAQYHMMQTRGLNWMNAEHCKAMLAFVQYLIRRNL